MADETDKAPRQATVYITKLAAARRQLTAAIRLFFANEDELAVHTIAHAAYHVLSDLKKKRGRDEVADTYLTAIFYTVRSYHRGTLPDYISRSNEMMTWVSDLANRLPITASSEVNDAKVAISASIAKQYWNERNRIANFLKHADRDGLTHVTVGEADNRLLITQGVSAYQDLTGEFLPEGKVFWTYCCVVTGDRGSLTGRFKEIGFELEKLTPRRQLALCAQWLRKLRRAQGRNRTE